MLFRVMHLYPIFSILGVGITLCISLSECRKPKGIAEKIRKVVKFTMKKTKKLTFCALMAAMSVVLMLISKVIPAPWLQGGSITIASTVPLIMAALLYGPKWGLLTSLTYAIIQLITGFYPPPTQTLLNFVLVVMLDYILAFGVFGLAGLFYKKDKPFTIPLSAFIVTTLRYVCHIISGLLIWGVYAEGQSVVAYSLSYNGSYMIPEIIINTVVMALLIRVVKNLEKRN